LAKQAKYRIDAIDFNFYIWGIHSPMEDYRLCWLLNNILQWDFRRVNDLEIYNDRDNMPMHFNAYKFENTADLYTIELIQNKHEGFILLPELKNFDYLFLFQGEEDYFNKDEITELLKKIQGIQSIFEIDIEQIKSKYKLLMRHLYDTE